MSVPVHLQSFWSEFGQATGQADDTLFYEAFCFGDSEELANELAALVVHGNKRATAGSLWSFQSKDKPLPQPGSLSIVTNWAGEPVCVIQTESVSVLPFCEVPAEFAAREGEGDGSLNFWRQAHRQYFTRECASAGRSFNENMLVACECFTLLYPRSQSAA